MRIRVLVVLIGLVGSTLLAQPGLAGEHVSVESLAWANWLLPTNTAHVFKWYAASALEYDNVGAATPPVQAVVAKGKCRVDPGSHGFALCVVVAGGVVPPASIRFSMAATGDTATLVVRHHGLNKVTWSGPLVATPAPVQGSCATPGGGGSERGALVYRSATATGRVLGRRLRSTHRFDSGLLLRYASLSSCLPFLRQFRRVAEGRPVRVMVNLTR